MTLRNLVVFMVSAFAALSGNVAALTCDECKAAARHTLVEWNVVEPGLMKDLPRLLCSSCPVRSSCEELVSSGIEALSLEINNTNETFVCDRLGMCNTTIMLG